MWLRRLRDCRSDEAEDAQAHEREGILRVAAVVAVTCLLAVPAAQAKDSGAVRDTASATARGIVGPLHVESGGFLSLGQAAPETCRSARKGLAFYMAWAKRWYAQMDKRITPRQRGRNCAHVRRLADNWHGRARIARQTFDAWLVAMLRKWACIHEHEGRWNANTGNGYWGGLQMSRWFQGTYGPEFYARWGTANRLPIWAQLVAAERAWRECECFRQWGTAWRCGLA